MRLTGKVALRLDRRVIGERYLLLLKAWLVVSVSRFRQCIVILPPLMVLQWKIGWFIHNAEH